VQLTDESEPPQTALLLYAGIISPAAPTITSIAPTSATATGPAFTLTVNGSSFTAASIVRWNTTQLTTTFVSSSALTAAVPASLIATAGTAQITVLTTGVTSNTVTFTVLPPPTITSISPANTVAGGPAFTLTVNGTGFAAGATAEWNGTPLTTTIVNANQLRA